MSDRPPETGSHDAPAAGTSPLHYSQSLRWLLVAAALASLALSSFFAYRRPLAPIADQPPRFPSLAWWDTPFELNARARVPQLAGTIKAITRSHDGRYIFLIGEPNLLLRHDRQTGEWLELPRIDWPKFKPQPATDPVSPQPAPADPQQFPTTPDYKANPSNAPLLDPSPRNTKKSAIPSRQRPVFPFVAAIGMQPWFLAQSAPPSPAIDEKSTPVTEEKTTTAASDTAAGAPAELLEFDFADAQFGFLEFDGRRLLTTDGGYTWNDEPLGFIPPNAAFEVTPGGTAFAIFDDGNGLKLVRANLTGANFDEQPLALPKTSEASSYSFVHGWLQERPAGRNPRFYRIQPDGVVKFVTELPLLQNPMAWEISPSGVGYFATLTEDEKAGGNTSIALHVADPQPTRIFPLPGEFTDSSYPQALSAPDASDLWLLHSGGQLARSSDGGITWSSKFFRKPGEPAPGVHVRLPPPWFFLTLIPIAGLLLLAWRLPPPERKPGIADRLASDKPIEAGEPDFLGFERVALGLSAYLRNRATTPPLTLAITGPWGGGKSSLMNLLKADLAKWGHKPVWFNAWHHETEEHLLAALLEAVRGQAIPGWFQRGGIGYRTRLLWRRGRRRVVLMSFLLIALGGSLGYLVARPDQIAAVQTTIGRHFAQFDTLRRLFALPDPEKTADEEKKSDDGHVKNDPPAAPVDTVAGTNPATADHPIPTGDTKASARKGPAEPEVTASARPAAFALFASLIGLIASLWKGLRAFGVEPARLLSSRSQRASHADLQAQTSFRHQFQQQFRDVTDALRPQTMAIFIDDLDRCQPEHAYKVLESVNFLMTSGSCYIVLGLERARIERGIGVLFKELAAEEPALPGDPEEESAPQRFARRYLEKLINLEVAVPSATPEQLANLLRDRVTRGDGMDPAARETESRRRRVLPAVDLTTVWMLLVPALAVVAFMISNSFFVGPPRDQVRRIETASKIVEQTKAGAPSSPGQPSPGDSGVHDAASSDAVVTPAVFRAGELGPQHFWIVLLLGLGVGALGVWRLSIPPGAETVDSEETGQAMDKVCPLLVDVPGITPRRIKQFINRVRYLSMMRGSYSAAPSWWSGQLALISSWLRRPRKPAASGSEASKSSDDKLDDAKLVLLGALYEISPATFTAHDGHRQLADLVLKQHLERMQKKQKAIPVDLARLVASITAEDLKRFNLLRQGVRLSDDAARVHANGEPQRKAAESADIPEPN